MLANGDRYKRGEIRTPGPLLSEMIPAVLQRATRGTPIARLSAGYGQAELGARLRRDSGQERHRLCASNLGAIIHYFEERDVCHIPYAWQSPSFDQDGPHSTHLDVYQKILVLMIDRNQLVMCALAAFRAHIAGRRLRGCRRQCEFVVEMVDKSFDQVAMVVGVNDPRDVGTLRLDDIEDKATALGCRLHKGLFTPFFSGMGVVFPIAVLLPGCNLPLNFFLVYSRDEFVQQRFWFIGVEIDCHVSSPILKGIADALFSGSLASVHKKS
jgi:hypothetical protein